MDDVKKQKGTSFVLHQALCILPTPSVNSNWSYSPETINSGQHRWYFSPCDLEIWRMTLKNNRAPLLCYFKLCALLHNHWWIHTVTVQKRPIWVKINYFFSHVTFQFDVWHWKTIGHLIYVTSSFVHYFVAIGEFNLELQSGNTQFGLNSTIFRAMWPWNLTDDLEQGNSKGFKSCDRPIVWKRPSSMHHFVAISEFKLELQSRNAQFGSKSMIF